MDNFIDSTIEKIKQQEQDIDNKLKEKREHEAELAALNRAIKDAVLQVAKSDQEQVEISERIQKLQPLIEIEKIRCASLLAQIQKYTKILEDLKVQANVGVAKVWSLRSSLCETVQSVSEVCDIWALLMRPVCTDPLPQVQPQVIFNNDEICAKLKSNENRLEAALQRRKDAEAKRERLLTEPDTADEFIRIKNALHYSLQKIENMQNK